MLQFLTFQQGALCCVSRRSPASQGLWWPPFSCPIPSHFSQEFGDPHK